MNSSNKSHKKYMEDSEENIHVDIVVKLEPGAVSSSLAKMYAEHPLGNARDICFACHC